MNNLIDTRGYSCPEPVIMVKDALVSGADVYTVLSDNRTSLENITRYAEHAGYSVSYKTHDELSSQDVLKAIATEDDYIITLTIV